MTTVYSRVVLGAIRTALPTRTALPSVTIPVGLFAASAAFVAWRNSQVGVLVDLAYLINIATRIALGDVPYSQFALAQAPGSFLIQAALIKLLGSHYVVQIAYAVVVGGVATALSWWIARRLLDGAVAAPGALAAVLSLPLIPLGVYAILPNPFYDSDACVVVLAAIAAVLAARDRSTPARWLLAGTLLTIPLFIKQNIGGAFFIAAAGVLIIEAFRDARARAGLRWCAGGALGALAIELAAMQAVVGIDSYVRWGWIFAMSGRGVTLARLREFADPLVVWPAVLIVLLVVVAVRLPARSRGPLFVAGLFAVLLVGAFAPLILLGVPQFFPPLLIASCVLAGARAVRAGESRTDVLIPLVLAATTLGTLQSQGLVSSSFGIFPLLTVAIAALVRDLVFFVPAPTRLAPVTGAIIAFILVVAGTGYTVLNIRLGFIDVNAPGPVARSTFPSLEGLSARGPYLGDLDAILFWMRDNVRPDEGFVFLPGEDPAFFALGRKPVLPSVYFYDVATPYSPAELARLAEGAKLRWVFVKDHPQLRELPPLEDELIARLTAGATHVTTVGSYRIFRR